MVRIKKILVYGFIILCVFIGLWTAQDNPQLVDIRLLGFPVGPIPLGFCLVIMLVTGMIVGMLASLPIMLRLGAENRRLKQKTRTL